MRKIINAAVIVASLGYFVDIYDLLLFSITRVESLGAIGYHGRELEVGAYLNNIQMTGLMVGGILWGILGDKKGRLSVLFGSIFLYSVANFFNAYAMNFTQFAFCRFFAGLGLAGELGAGITLVSEVLAPEMRGYGTMLVATIGVSGAVFGGWVAQTFDWRTAYQIGGALGFALLFLRLGVSESSVFKKTSDQVGVERGNFLSLLTHSGRFKRFIFCIFAGVPLWFTVGILIAYAPEFAKHFGMTESISAGKSVMACYGGLVLGDLIFSMIAQWTKSRKKAILSAIILNSISTVIYLLFLHEISPTFFYVFCFILGTTCGDWAMVCTMAAEQFGTNLRATVATAVPNFIRFALVPMNFAVLALKGRWGLVQSALFIGVTVLVVAFLSVWALPESFGKDLNFVEEN